LFYRKQGQRDSRIALKVPDFVMLRQMPDYELFMLYSDPHYGDLRTAVWIARSQISQRSLW